MEVVEAEEEEGEGRGEIMGKAVAAGVYSGM